MAESRAVWGIDIGQYALKAVKLKYAEAAGQAVAVAFDYIPHPKILSQPDAIPEELIPQALETFLSRNDIQGDPIAISVPGQSALARFIQLPPVESSKVAEIVKYEARQQIPFALDEVIWDYQPLGAGSEESGYLLDAEVGLFAMKRDLIEQQLRPFTDQKVEIELIQIAPLALYNMLCYDELGMRPGQDIELGDDYYIVLDMGCDTTTLMVSNGGKIWIRNVPIGGNHFTRALTKEMKLSFAKAEHLKCNATKSPDPRAVFQALRPVFNDYVSEIQRSIGYFSSVNREAKIAKVIGVGNGFKLAGLQKFLQQNLQYEVERPDTYDGLAGDAVLNAPLFQENLLSFAVPYGLGIQALELGQVRTTLLPPEIATARKIRRKKPWAVLTAAVLLFGLALSTIGNSITYGVVHTDEFAEAQGEADKLAGEVSTLESAYQSQVSRFESAKQVTADLVEGRRDLEWLELYTSINACLPRDAGDDQDQVDIEKRNQVMIASMTSEHMADVADWYNELPPSSLEHMEAADRDEAPTGEGYVFTVNGLHYHHDPNDPNMQRINYVINTFLKNLQKWQHMPPDANRPKPHDVERMGITHASVTHFAYSTKKFYPNGLPESQSAQGTMLPQTSPRGRRGLGGRRGPRAPIVTQPLRVEDEGDFRELIKTTFTIQFAWIPVPPEERAESDPEAEGASVDGATE